MFCSIFRLSSSSLVSPAPLALNEPPPCLDRLEDIPASLGNMYRCWAKETSNTDSFVCARSANIDKIKKLRSMICTSSSSSKCLICAGDKTSSKITIWISKTAIACLISCTLPLPI